MLPTRAWCFVLDATLRFYASGPGPLRTLPTRAWCFVLDATLRFYALGQDGPIRFPLALGGLFLVQLSDLMP